MKSIKSFIAGKGTGFWLTVATFVLMLLAVIFYAALISVSSESTETPAAVIVCIVICMVLCLVTAFKDFFHVISLAAFVAATLSMCYFITGRVSYVAFYFSGDIMGTGFSPLFVVAAICIILGVITSACAVCFRQEKPARAADAISA